MDEDLRPMDYEAVTRLAQHVHDATLAHFARGPKDNAQVLECLNALAAVVATVLRGADFNADVTIFFFRALQGCASAEPNQSETIQ